MRAISAPTSSPALTVTYRRPTPLLTELQFEVERAPEGRRILSTARLMADGVVLCDAQMSAVAGNLSRLPEISPRKVEA